MQGMITTQSIVDAPIINTFGLPEATVSPSDQLITLTLGQLQDLVRQAIERATAPLTARLDAMEERGVGCREGGEDASDSHKRQDNLLQVVQNLLAENMALKRELEAFQEHVAQERAFDRQRLARLEHKEPQPLQKDRGEILRALIAANGGKMLATDARKKMHLTKPLFSMLLASMGDDVDIKPLHSDKRKRVLTLK